MIVFPLLGHAWLCQIPKHKDVRASQPVLAAGCWMLGLPLCCLHARLLAEAGPAGPTKAATPSAATQLTRRVCSPLVWLQVENLRGRLVKIITDFRTQVGAAATSNPLAKTGGSVLLRAAVTSGQSGGAAMAQRPATRVPSC